MRNMIYRVAVLLTAVLAFAWLDARPALAQWGSFGEVKIGESRTLPLSIGCYESRPCWRVTRYEIVGPNRDEFKIVGTDCGSFTGDPNTSCILETTFTPKAPVGPKDAYLALYGPEGQTAQFAITGAAIAGSPPPRRVRIEISPSNPTTSNRLLVKITGEWTDSCVPQSPVVSIVGSAIQIATSNPRAGCLNALTPFEVQTSIDPLQAGRYNLTASFNGETIAQGTVIVTDGPRKPTLLASNVATPAGGTTTVTWTGITAPTPRDWIGLFAANAPDSASIWYYRTGGTAAGTLAFRLPASLAAGDYEFRLFSDATLNRLATSNRILVTGSGGGEEVTLTASPTVRFAGEAVTLTWKGIATPKPLDWIGLFRSGSSDDASIWYHRTGGSASGTLQFRIPEMLSQDIWLPGGIYEFRLFSDATLNRLASSNAVTVQFRGPL